MEAREQGSVSLSSYIWVQTAQKMHPSSQTLLFSYASDWFLPKGDWCCLNHMFSRLKEGPCYVTTPGESSHTSGTTLSTCPAFSMRLNLTEVKGIYRRCGYERAQMDMAMEQKGFQKLSQHKKHANGINLQILSLQSFLLPPPSSFLILAIFIHPIILCGIFTFSSYFTNTLLLYLFYFIVLFSWWLRNRKFMGFGLPQLTVLMLNGWLWVDRHL